MSLPTPITRKEAYLAAIAGEEVQVPEKPITREEAYLDAIAKGGGGGGTIDPTPTEGSTNAVSSGGTYTALAGKLDASEKGTASGVAELDANGKVLSSQLPSFVDDVVEGYYDSVTDRFYEESTFEHVIDPVEGKSWVDIPANKSYRWTGSVYVRVDEGVQLGETSNSAFRGDWGKTLKDTMGTGTLDTTAQTVIPAINELNTGKANTSDITNAINALDVSSVGGTGKYISAISEADGKISATAETMDTTPTANSVKPVTSGGIKTAIDDSVALKTATGNPMSLTDVANANAEELSMTIEPIQSGSGDPSPTNVRPISGLTEGEVTRTGKNLFGNFELNKSISSETGENLDDVTGGFRTAGKIRTAGYTAISLTLLDSQYKGSFIVLQYSDSGYIGVVDEIQCAQIQYPYNRTLTLNPETTYIRIKGWYGTNISSINTAQFQVTLGTTPTAYEPYTATTATITFGQTVYGGTVNFKTGEVTVTHANIASYNGESINEPWLSSIDKYVSGATPTTGAQVVYPLTTPTTLTLTPAELELLKGNNTITANGAEISIEYYPDNAIGALAGRVDGKADEEDVAVPKYDATNRREYYEGGAAFGGNIDSSPTAGSNNAVSSGGTKAYVDNAVATKRSLAASSSIIGNGVNIPSATSASPFITPHEGFVRFDGPSCLCINDYRIMKSSANGDIKGMWLPKGVSIYFTDGTPPIAQWFNCSNE